MINCTDECPRLEDCRGINIFTIVDSSFSGWRGAYAAKLKHPGKPTCAALLPFFTDGKSTKTKSACWPSKKSNQGSETKPEEAYITG